MWQCWHSRQLFLSWLGYSLPMLFFDIIKVVSITSSKLSRTFTLLPHCSFLVFSRKMVWTEVVPNESEVKPGQCCSLHPFVSLFRLALDCTGFAFPQITLISFYLQNFDLFWHDLLFSVCTLLFIYYFVCLLLYLSLFTAFF